MNVSAVDGDRGNPNQIGYKLQGEKIVSFISQKVASWINLFDRG